MSTTLRPCPMCGRDDSEDNAIQDAAVVLRHVPTPLGRRAYEVSCVCGVIGPRFIESDKAIAAWNRRADGWQPIESAVQDETILVTDGKWFAAAVMSDDGFRKCSINHFAVCHEYDWQPTHWMPLPAAPEVPS